MRLRTLSAQCDGCGRHSAAQVTVVVGGPAAGRAANELARLLRIEGWERTPGSDWCPRCPVPDG